MKLDEPNYEGAKYVTENFSYEKESQKLRKIIKDLHDGF